MTAGKTVLLVGLGLIGGSLAKALHRRSDKYRVLAADANRAALVKAKTHGWIDDWTDEPADAAGGADIVILCVPVLSMPDLAEKVGRRMKKGAVLSDVGSVKEFLASPLSESLPPGVSYVGGHPMAGSEKSGLDAARADIFLGRPYVVIPSPQAQKHATAAITDLARAVGAVPMLMEAAEHDQAVALVSHMPHVLATALMLAATADSAVEARLLAAGCFRDMTRVSGADATMWTDICEANARAIIDKIEKVEEVLSAAKEKIAQKDRGWLTDFFERARAGRELFVPAAPEARSERP